MPFEGDFRRQEILYLLMVFIVFLYPTSMNGVILESDSSIIVYYSICIFTVLWYILGKKISVKGIVILVSILMYMLFASFVSLEILGGEVVVARIVYILLSLMLLLFHSNKRVTEKFAIITNEILTLTIIVWNIGIIFDFKVIKDITVNYYSQFNWYTTSVFVENNRPIFTFGIYSYGAFFYAMLFILWMYFAIKTKNNKPHLAKRYYIYAFSFIIFQFLMAGSTSIFLGIIMLIAFLKIMGKNKFSILMIPGIIIFGIYFLSRQNYDWSRIIFGTSTNGFAVRYLTNWFENNILAVKETILGIGFTVPEKYNLIFSDSGYIILFTMGNIFLPLIFYSYLYKNLRKNLPKELFWYAFIVIMLFEFALPGLLYPKQIIFIMFFYMSVKSVTINQPNYHRKYKEV